MGALLIDDFIRNMLSVPFSPCHLSIPFCPMPFCPYTILSIQFCPYHFVRYHFVLEPFKVLCVFLTLFEPNITLSSNQSKATQTPALLNHIQQTCNYDTMQFFLCVVSFYSVTPIQRLAQYRRLPLVLLFTRGVVADWLESSESNAECSSSSLVIDS